MIVDDHPCSNDELSKPLRVEDSILKLATREQTHEALLQRYDAEGPLTLPQHVERANVLGSLKYAEGRQKYWVLIRKGSREGDFLSSVATIERSVIIQRSYSKDEGDLAADTDHSPIVENAFSITHVYTPPDLRQRGYATKMMSLLHEKLRPRLHEFLDDTGAAHHEIPAKGILSFLYSGVGEFYSKCGSPGWHIQTSTETYRNTASVVEEGVDQSHNFSLRLITEQDFVDIGRRDADLLREHLEARSRQGLGPRQFAVLPTGDEFAWLVARSKFYGKILSDLPLPEYWGVEVVDGDSTNARENFAVWFFDYVKKELHFLRLRCWDAKALKVIVHAAALAAKDQGCERLLAWNVDEELLLACPQNDRVSQPRKKNLAAVAWYGEGDCPEWAANEKYGWC